MSNRRTKFTITAATLALVLSGCGGVNADDEESGGDGKPATSPAWGSPATRSPIPRP